MVSALSVDTAIERLLQRGAQVSSLVELQLLKAENERLKAQLGAVQAEDDGEIERLWGAIGKRVWFALAGRRGSGASAFCTMPYRAAAQRTWKCNWPLHVRLEAGNCQADRSLWTQQVRLATMLALPAPAAQPCYGSRCGGNCRESCRGSCAVFCVAGHAVGVGYLNDVGKPASAKGGVCT